MEKGRASVWSLGSALRLFEPCVWEGKKKHELIDLGCQNCYEEEVGGACSESAAHAVPLLRVIHWLFSAGKAGAGCV